MVATPLPVDHCYMLAKLYGVHPGEFLRETFSVIAQHMMHTDAMLTELAEDAERDG